MERARARGVADIVEFDDGYRSLDELAALVATADVVLLPYESREQVTSGVLVEAIAAGKPVVATEFPHAVEMLASGAGMVIRHDDPYRMGRALWSVLTNHPLAASMRAEAARISPSLLWPNVGAEFDSLVSSLLGQHTDRAHA
jgi:polysaccharide biosynthesis protein PslF